MHIRDVPMDVYRYMYIANFLKIYSCLNIFQQIMDWYQETVSSH